MIDLERWSEKTSATSLCSFVSARGDNDSYSFPKYIRCEFLHALPAPEWIVYNTASPGFSIFANPLAPPFSNEHSPLHNKMPYIPLIV